MDIKVGDKVELAKTSEYYDIEDKSQLSGVGVVDKVLSGIGSLRYIVTWGGEGRRNGYGEIDLVLVDDTQQPLNKYHREVKKGVYVDVYDVLRAFNVTDPCLQHMLKKCLANGVRGHKDATEDYQDILASAKRALELHLEWKEVK